MRYACRMCLFKKLLLTEMSKLQSSILKGDIYYDFCKLAYKLLAVVGILKM